MVNPDPIDPKKLDAPAGFFKLDLHVHTPISFCYEHEFRHVGVDEIVETAVACNLDAIAITDHNSAKMVDQFRRAGDRYGLAIFPGTEITTHQGHLLAIFDREEPSDTIWSLLESIEVPSGTHGDGTKRVVDPMEIVIEKIAERGGIAIPAHIDRFPNGFWAGNFDHKIRRSLFNHAFVEVVEITAPRDKEKWNTGKMSYFASPRAVIQDSDAHAPYELSRRPTFYKVNGLHLADLRAAYADFENAIRFPTEIAALQS